MANYQLELNLNQFSNKFNREQQSLTVEYVAEDYFKITRDLLGTSESTIVGYKSDYKELVNYIKEKGLINDIRYITPGILEDFLSELKRKGLSINTLHRKKDAISSLFKYAIKQEWVGRNPVQSVKLARRKKNYRKVFLSFNEINDFLKAEVKIRGYTADMLKTAKSTLVFTGMRESEIRKIDWEHMDLEKGQLKVFNTKNTNKKDTEGGLDRIIPLCKPLYVAIKKLYVPGQTGAFFQNENKKRLTKGALSSLVKRSASEANIGDITPHGFRHNLSSHLEKLGATQSDRELLLGHAPQSTTGGYTHSNEERLKHFLEDFADEVFAFRLKNEELSIEGYTDYISTNNSKRNNNIEEDGGNHFTGIIDENTLCMVDKYMIEKARISWYSLMGDSPMTADFLLGFIARNR